MAGISYYNNHGQVVPETSFDVVLVKRETGSVTYYKAKVNLLGDFFKRDEIMRGKRATDISISEKTFNTLLKYYTEGGEHLYWRALKSE